jgi:hydrogenase small subunit
MPVGTRSSARSSDVKDVHILWLTAGLSCDGDSVSITAAEQPSIEDVLLGNIPGIPRTHLHNPVLAKEVGDDFMKFFYMAESGELDPFVLVVEGSIPNEDIKNGGYWAAQGTDPNTGQPIPTVEWIDRLAPKAWAVVAAGTCATYGGIHAMEGNPTGCMGLADYLGWEWRSTAGIPIVNVPGCPVQPDNFMETLTYLLYQAAGMSPMIPLDDKLRPTWLFGKTVHEGCDRAGYYEQADFTHEYGESKCLVKIGCWGPVVNCNIVQRGAINHMGGCMRAGGVCIGCTMPGFPDKFSPFYKTPPGAAVSTFAARTVGGVVRRLRRLSNREANREHRWDVTGEVPSGWANVQAQTLTDKAIKFFYAKWQHMASKKPGRLPGEQDRFWGVDRPGYRRDYLDESAGREDSHDQR